VDKRPDAEIRVGAALNALEALENDLADMEASIREADFTEDVKLELRQGYDYIKLARKSVDRLFERIKPDPVSWLKSSKNRDSGREAMQPVIKFYREALSCLATAHMRAFRSMPHEWEHRRLWDRIYDDRMGSVDDLIRSADRSFIVAGFQPRKSD
jgi:hypothetical protein